MAIVGKITNQGFVGNLQGTASVATDYANSGSINSALSALNTAVEQRLTEADFNAWTGSASSEFAGKAAKVQTTDKKKAYAADELFESMTADGATITVKVGNVEKSASVTGVAPAAHTHSFSDVTNLPESASKWNGAAASASSEASLTFNPGTGLKINLTASFAGKTASAAFDAAHSHDDKLDIADFNTYTSSIKPAIDKVTSSSASWDAAEANAKSYAKPAVDYVAASASVLDAVKAEVIANSGSWNKAQENVIEEIKVNGTKVDPVSKSVNIEIPAAAEYTITKDTGSSTYSAVYHLTKDGTAVGEAINIPKDMVIKAAAVITYNGTDTKITVGGVQYDVEGTHAAGKYVVMIVNNAAAGASQIWIDVKDLVDVYTAGNGINVSASNVISAVAKSGDKYIEVTADGIASKGIDAAINAASASVKSYADASSENAAKRAIASGSVALNAYTASNNARVSALETATGSLDGRLDSIEGKSGSWDSAASWVGSNSSSLATNASMAQNGYALTASFRGQTASVNIASASYAANADHAVDATKVVSGSVQMYVKDNEFIFYIPD